MDFDVFIDESGTFCEGSRIKEEVEIFRTDPSPSQLLAVVAPRGWLTETRAWQLLQDEYQAWQLNPESEFHATELKQNREVDFSEQVIAAANKLLGQRPNGLLVFRLYNHERICFGDRRSTYTNMSAELLARICNALEQQSSEQANRSGVNLFLFQASMRRLAHEEGELHWWATADYYPAIKTTFLRLAIAKGWAEELRKWKLVNFELVSARKDKRVWLCDLISNSTYRNMNSVSDPAKTALKRLLGDYDFTLTVNLTLEKARELAARQAFGLALHELAEKHASEWTNAQTRGDCNQEARKVVAALFAAPTTVPAQLQLVVTSLQQMAEDRARGEEVRKCCKWLRDLVLTQWPAQLDGDKAVYKDWFDLALRSTELTACNHAGMLREGADISGKIDQLVPLLAGHWEFAPELLQALIRQGVHYNDRFEFSQTVERMKMIAAYFKDLGGLFNTAFPAVFPEQIRSRQRGEALGTMLQAQTALVNLGEASLEEARSTSETAIKEFSRLVDQLRQFQYRSELEAIAGEWEPARNYLARGIEANESSHAGLADRIVAIADQYRGFPLLHWTRIGALAADRALDSSLDQTARRAAEEELAAFQTAWQQSGLGQTRWANGEEQQYPAHNILRRLAGIQAAAGRGDLVTNTLRLLRAVNDSARPAAPLFLLLEATTVLHAAAVLGIVGSPQAKTLVRGVTGVSQPIELLQSVRRQVETNPPGQLVATIDLLVERAQPVWSGSGDFQSLHAACRRIGY